MASHAQAREWAHDGFVLQFQREPTLAEVQFVQAIALLESGYGQGWKNDGVGSWNMGAVQAGRPPCNPETSFSYTDTHPNSDGTSTPYTICFRKYPGPVEGMADVARILYKQMSIIPSSIRAVSTQMYEKHYYEGFGATKEARINNHVKALTAGLEKITTALGEPIPSAEGGPGGSPKEPEPDYSQLEWLSVLALSLSEDARDRKYAKLPPRTELRIRQYQKQNGLYVDGIPGPKTLAALFRLT